LIKISTNAFFNKWFYIYFSSLNRGAAISEYFFPIDSGIGQLCEDLNEIVGQGIYYDTFEIQNTKWFWFISNMVTALNNKKIV